MAEELPDPPIAPQIPGEGIHPLRTVLPGLEEREVVASIADGVDVEALLDGARVVCFRGEGYPRVDDHTGHILCPSTYATSHHPVVVYLDLIHELVHVRQVREGEQVYHFPEPYVAWPTEREAYRITYEEAQRLGLSDAWFWRYLSVPWIEDDEIATLARAIGMPEDAVPADTDEGEQAARH